MIHRLERQIAITAAVLLAGLATAAQAQPAARRPLSLDDMFALAQVSDPQISPDGQWVAYTVQTIDTKKDRRTSDIWMVSWDGTRKLQLTSTPESEHHPRFSPDGKYLSFLSSRTSEDQIAQLWLMDRAGGEARRVTDFKGSVSDYEWAPTASGWCWSCTTKIPKRPSRRARTRRTRRRRRS